MARARDKLAVLGALTPFALGGALLNGSAADARRTDPQGLRPSGGTEKVSASEAQDLARAALKGGDTVRALELYRQVLARDPNAIDAMNGIAVCYDRLGQFDVSRAYYEAALGLDPQSAPLLNNYGYSLFLQGKLEEARRFLGLAAASEDAAVQASSLRILARIDAAAARAQAETPPLPVADASPASPRIVRTSSHEQRLMLGDAKQPPQMVASLGAEAAAVAAPVTRLSEAEEQAIFAHEERLVRLEALRRLDTLRSKDVAAPHPVVPAQMQAMLTAAQAMPSLQTVEFAAFTASPGSADIPVLPGHALDSWAPAESRPQAAARRDGLMLAALPSGLLVQRFGARPAPAQLLPAAEPLARKRSFDAPFLSDLEKLNGFAARLHGQERVDDADLTAKIALLQDLIDRTRQA